MLQRLKNEIVSGLDLMIVRELVEWYLFWSTDVVLRSKMESALVLIQLHILSQKYHELDTQLFK